MNVNNLTPEDIKFIKELSHEIKTQDTRGTAQPYGLTVLQEFMYPTCGGYADELVCEWGDRLYREDEWDEFVEDIKEVYEDDIVEEIESMDGFLDLMDSSLSDEIEASVSYVIIDRKPDPMRFNFFLTEKAAQEYIEKDKHNLHNPSLFGVYLHKNDEMKKLIEIIHKLAEAL